MSESEVIRIPVEPGKAGALAAIVASAREGGYLAPPRCAAARVLTGEDAGELVVLLDWRSRADHDEAAAEPAAGELFGRIAGLAAGAPVVGWYEERG